MIRPFRNLIRLAKLEIHVSSYSVNKHRRRQFATKTNEDNFKTNNKQKQRTSLPSIKNPFESVSEKTKESYLAMVEIFNERDVHRRNHVEFIYAALRYMSEYGVANDLDVYKALINVMPKGKFLPTNVFQSEFMHYPKQQQCIIDLLEQMEDYAVMPDYEMEAMLLNIFGRKGYPLRKYWRMMYWMPKFRNLSPWQLPQTMPNCTLELAKLAIERMCTIDLRSQVNVFETKDVSDAIDDTWIVSGMSNEQSQLLKDHPRNKALYIEGPFLIWLRNRSLNYFTLRAEPDLKHLESFNKNDYNEDDVSNLEVPLFGRVGKANKQLDKCRSVHEQADGTIFAICATGTSTKDSLLSWIRLLQANGNPVLNEISILFRFTSKISEEKIKIESSNRSSETIESSTQT